MSIYKRKDSWHYDFWVRRKRYRGAIGSISKTKARQCHEKLRTEALEGRLIQKPLKAPMLERYSIEKSEFSDAAGQYLSYYKQHHKPRSALRMHTALVSLCRSFGNNRLDEINPFQIERYKSMRKEAGFADATVNRELACLKNLFNMGILWKWVRENPVRSVKLFREDNARIRWLTLEEEAELFKHCDTKLKTFCLTAIDCGFRARELQSLRWQDVDFQRRQITVHSGYTKNGETRTNPITVRLEVELRKWKGLNSSGGGAVFGEFRYREPFEAAREEAKLGKDAVFHTLRHTYISRLVMAGVNLRVVQELAGHKTITMTMRYSHLAREHKQQAIGLLESSLQGQVPANVPTMAVLENKPDDVKVAA